MSIKPTVSIICLTYNQEKYVRDCLEGFVMQQTSFPFEVLVYDDASTDSTPEIIRDYAAKYTEIFKPTLYQENNFSKGLGYVGLYTGIKEAKGVYVAYCEGDDYWTDPLKLQKQVDFLEAHPNYEVCAHETLIKNDRYKQLDGLLFNEFNKNLFVSTTKKHYTFEDALTGNIFHVSSLMYRNFPIQLPEWLPQVSAADMVLFMLLAEKGDVYVMPEVMSVYRSHEESLTSSNKEYNSSVLYYLNLSIPVLGLLNQYWNGQYQSKIYPIIARYYAECAVLYTNKSIRDLTKSKQMAMMACQYSKMTAVSSIGKGLLKKVFRVK